MSTTVSFVVEWHTLPSFATQDGSRWHCWCFKFELESFHFLRRQMSHRSASIYLLSEISFQLGGSWTQIFSLLVGSSCRQICSRTNTTRIFETRLGLSHGPVQVQGQKLRNILLLLFPQSFTFSRQRRFFPRPPLIFPTWISKFRVRHETRGGI